MRQELDEKLCADYPKIFAERHGKPQNTAMCFGFECGDGWYWLIDQLCNLIQGRIDNNPHLNIHQPIAVQVKEKWAGLRFYTNSHDEQTDGMIQLAEHMSYSICEECGSTKDIGTTNGWFKTICSQCFLKEQAAGSNIGTRKWTPNDKPEEKEDENI